MAHVQAFASEFHMADRDTETGMLTLVDVDGDLRTVHASHVTWVETEAAQHPLEFDIAQNARRNAVDLARQAGAMAMRRA